MDSEDQRDEPEPTYQDYLDEQEHLAHLWEEELRETLERLSPLGVLEGLSDDHQLSLAEVFWEAEQDFLGRKHQHEYFGKQQRKTQLAVSRKLKSANRAFVKAQVALTEVLAAIDDTPQGRFRLRTVRSECAALRDSMAPGVPSLPVLSRISDQEVLQKIRDDLQATFRGFKLGKGQAAVRTLKIAKVHFDDSVEPDDFGNSVPAYRIAEKRKRKSSRR